MLFEIVLVLRFFFLFALRSVIGPEKLALLSQPIRCETKTTYDLVALIFPRFRQFDCVYVGGFFSSDWLF